MKKRINQNITLRSLIVHISVIFPLIFIVCVTMGALGVIHTNGTVNAVSALALVGDSLLISIFVSAVSALAIILPIHRIRKRLISYTSSIREMTDDKIGEKLEISGEDEISKLGEAFNDMSDKYAIIEKQRTEFVSNASHELKTPLSSIKLMADSIIQTPDIEMDYVREFLTDMNEEVERLNRIVNKLLYITKLDTLTETMSGPLELINLRDVVTGVRKNLAPIADMENKTLDVKAEEDILIMANKDMLWQALYNIADNALKYTGDDGRVVIELFKDKKRAVISVKDNGVGISSEDLHRIFDRFYRVDKARSRETGGTGLGLSIAYSAVEFHNGTIEVESTPGEGSLFNIILPLVDWL